MTQKTVEIFRASNGISEILKQAVRDAGLRGLRRIFVKPNLSHPEYVPGVVTDPALAFELVNLMRNEAEEVVVGESDGFNYSCSLAFEKTGMAAAVKKAGGTIVNLSDDKVVEAKFENCSSVKRLLLPKTLLDADAVVDLCLMKTHEFMAYSGAIKNLFGCVPSNRRIYLHPYLPEVLYRLYTLLKPQLTVMDARVGIEGNGPTKGDPVKMDLLLTGNSALATDIIATRIMRLNWKETYLNHIAEKTGLREDSIRVRGLQVSAIARKFEPPKIDLPVKAQMEIYKHEFLTKVFFSSLDVVKLFQKVTFAYRGRPIQIA
jgi:uncharacterized protein (DUF362 family)